MSNKKKALIDEENKKEILYNIINALLAGGLVFLGSCSSGEFSFRGLSLALVASLIVILTKFKEYWDGEKGEYSAKLFKFV